MRMPGRFQPLGRLWEGRGQSNARLGGKSGPCLANFGVLTALAGDHDLCLVSCRVVDVFGVLGGSEGFPCPRPLVCSGGDT